MNTLPPPFTPSAGVAPSSSSDGCEIGVGFWFPREHQLFHGSALDSFPVFFSIVKGLEQVLQREGVLTKELTPAGDCCDGLILFRTRKPELAIAIVRELRQKNPIFRMFSCLARFDQGELAWRIVEHGLMPVQFDEFLKPEREQARLATLERAVEAIRNMLGESFDPSPQ